MPAKWQMGFNLAFKELTPERRGHYKKPAIYRMFQNG
jgi:hypothetical protein